jgi:Rrf2 family transcriptional regulator, nitric oxide-sensitive transcriptional repressor
MRLTRFSDNAVRCLIALAVQPDEAVSTERIAQQMGMSTDHLVKVVRRLAALGYVTTSRGRQGGVQLARHPAAINLGEVIRATEDNLDLVECFDPGSSECPIAPACVLAPALDRALEAFFGVLSAYTLADIAAPRRELITLLRG